MLDSIINGLLENGIIIQNDVHLAIVNEPFLSYIKNGEKIIESRFTKNKIAPFFQIHEGDIVCMKAAGKPIDCVFIVGDLHFYENTPYVLKKIREKYSSEICACDDSFWESRKDKKYISLIGIKDVKKLERVFNVPKKDKRAWIRFAITAPQNIFLIAGKIGSGKSYWADIIASSFDCSRATFSSYIKYKCTLASIACTRQNMQNLGTDAINNELDQFICYTLLYNLKNNKNIVVDGLRHLDVYKRIKELYPNTNVVLIYIDCDEEQRKKNLHIRGEDTTQADKDEMETKSVFLKELAHYVIHYDDDILETMKEIANLFSEIPIDFWLKQEKIKV